MTSENICLYNKYGHYKFSDTCHHHHVTDICEETNCETEKCLKRHPRNCRFCENYNRCKFGDNCFFSQRTLENGNPGEHDTEVADKKAKISALETLMKAKDSEMENPNEKVLKIEHKHLELETEMRKAIENVVKDATASLLEIFSKQQDEMEKRNAENLTPCTTNLP
jgi:hypothetical protein